MNYYTYFISEGSEYTKEKIINDFVDYMEAYDTFFRKLVKKYINEKYGMVEFEGKKYRAYDVLDRDKIDGVCYRFMRRYAEEVVNNLKSGDKFAYDKDYSILAK